jgi:adenosine deaminase
LTEDLRPSTIIELANELKYNKLPTGMIAVNWLNGSTEVLTKETLVEYLQGFEHTTAVMQTRESLESVAYEMMEDMKNDGVCYVETRFAPSFI